MSAPAEPVTIRTIRGNLTISPGGRLTGLRELIRRELLSKRQARQLCGFSQRRTLLRWRNDPRDPFPAPWLEINDAGGSGTVELWSRTEIELWLEQTAGRRRG